MNKEILALLLVSLVVLVSGCTMPFGGGGEEQATPGPGTKGVVIESFTSDIDYIVGDGTQKIDLKLTARNIGSEIAKDIKVRGQRLSWSGFLTEKDCATELEPPNPEINKEGQICVVTWEDLTVPEVKKVQDYTATAILSYDYKTTATSNAYVIKNWKLQAMKEAGETIPRTEPTVNSDAPVQLEFRFSEDPLIAKEDGNRTVAGTLIIRKVGTGNLEYDKTARRYKIDSIKIEDPSISGITIDSGTCSGVVNMRGDREGECNFKVNIDGSKLPSDIVKVPLKAIANYTFVVGKDLILTVHPKLE